MDLVNFIKEKYIYPITDIFTPQKYIEHRTNTKKFLQDLETCINNKESIRGKFIIDDVDQSQHYNFFAADEYHNISKHGISEISFNPNYSSYPYNRYYHIIYNNGKIKIEFDD